MASVGQGGYLSPMAAFAAALMQHMATINGIPGAPMTPTSGRREGLTVGLSRVRCQILSISVGQATAVQLHTQILCHLSFYPSET